MKLHNYSAYSPLMPQFNAMHAPAWLYAHYGGVALAFFYILKALRLLDEDRSAALSVAQPVGLSKLLLLAAAFFPPCTAAAGEAPAPLDRAFNRIYNRDFSKAHSILDELVRKDPSEPLVYSVRAATHLFDEFQRMRILETEFFADDEQITDKKRLKPDPSCRARLFQATAEARMLAKAKLAADPNHREAMFAVGMAAGVETEYTNLVEKRYLRSYSLSKESQQYTPRLLVLLR